MKALGILFCLFTPQNENREEKSVHNTDFSVQSNQAIEDQSKIRYNDKNLFSEYPNEQENRNG